MCGVPNLSPSSPKFPIAYVEIRVFSHATEDLENVETAVRNTLPETLAADVAFTKTTCMGHHGNPIVLLEANFADRKTLLSALETFGSLLSSIDKEQLDIELKQHIERHNLYLRLDKQNAFLGKLSLSSVDPIHFKIHFKNKTPDEIIDICKQAGLLP
jgi:RNA binding exosome subunit